jgi:hypothetical protein
MSGAAECAREQNRREIILAENARRREADLRAENARLREALVYIGKVCISHDQGDEAGRVLGYIADHSRKALEVKP